MGTTRSHHQNFFQAFTSTLIHLGDDSADPTVVPHIFGCLVFPRIGIKATRSILNVRYCV